MAGLAMETSKSEPSDRNQAQAKLNRDAYVDSNPYVESSVDRYAYVEVQLYLLLVASRTENSDGEISDEAFSVEEEDPYGSCCQQIPCKELLLTKLLKMKQQVTVDEAVISNDDVSFISRQQDGSAAVTLAESVDGSPMMTSAVMSSQSAVEQKQYQQLIREAQEMERRRLTLKSDVAQRKDESRRELQYTVVGRISCWNDEQKMKQISAGIDENNQLKHIQNQQLMSDTNCKRLGVHGSAVEEVNEPDVVVQLLTYQMLINRGESVVGMTNKTTQLLVQLSPAVLPSVVAPAPF
ncbi:hypothetical protein F511_33124 [Dorcoceras hygrometricum]|uniref:Uncharacterized protein n=1 Tax=Dorcoceras hygrometricum TaxID=472368 RepID=A0A2Z7CUV0_9LAMI|nr:hypothetical protein F511_33124 [Dorcoceras hygrometricum]